MRRQGGGGKCPLARESIGERYGWEGAPERTEKARIATI
jgi:hypothetical protein